MRAVFSDQAGGPPLPDPFRSSRDDWKRPIQPAPQTVADGEFFFELGDVLPNLEGLDGVVMQWGEGKNTTHFHPISADEVRNLLVRASMTEGGVVEWNGFQVFPVSVCEWRGMASVHFRTVGRFNRPRTKGAQPIFITVGSREELAA